VTDQPTTPDNSATSQINAPWTADQVAALERFQTEGHMHPFTCGGDQHSMAPRMIPSRSGWHCPDPDCSYTQDWAHAFMADPSQWLVSPFGNRHGPTPEEVRDWVAVRDREMEQLRARVAELEQVSRGYCPDCGRGDCAPTGEDWDRERKRAQRAEAALAEARMWARHGYEIGQRSCTWADHGVAPAWLTEQQPTTTEASQ
jgi:hypothetical protein